MAEQIDINGKTYTVYDSLENVDAYLEADLSLQSGWDDADDTEKNRALVGATRVLERLRWLGKRTDEGQALAWPRSGLKDIEGVAVDEDETPQEVLDAFAKLAGLIRATPSLVDEPAPAVNRRRLKAGSVEVENFRPQARRKLPPGVLELVRVYLQGAASTPVASGVEGSSQYEDSQVYPLSGGVG